MKRIYNDNEVLTPDGRILYDDVRTNLKHIFAEYIKRGFKIRGISHLISEANRDLEAELVILKGIKNRVFNRRKEDAKV